MSAQQVESVSPTILAECVLSILQGTNCGGLLIGSEKEVIAFNAEAEKHIGTTLRVEKGKLRAGSRESDVELQAIFDQHLRSPGTRATREAAALLRAGRRPLLMRFVPV